MRVSDAIQFCDNSTSDPSVLSEFKRVIRRSNSRGYVVARVTRELEEGESDILSSSRRESLSNTRTPRIRGPMIHARGQDRACDGEMIGARYCLACLKRKANGIAGAAGDPAFGKWSRDRSFSQPSSSSSAARVKSDREKACTGIGKCDVGRTHTDRKRGGE